MGIGATERLNLFNPDKSVGDAKQLRALFYAMAAYEIGGGFNVPDVVFDAGLALVRGETVAAAAGVGGGPEGEAGPSAINSGETTAAGAGEWKIGGSVGRRDKGAVNAGADVETVQELLRHASMTLRNPKFDPGDIDGEIAPAVEDSATAAAISAFQSRFMDDPDGLIEVGGRTWRELLAVLEGSGPLEEGPTGSRDASARFFPFAGLPEVNWTDAPRRFGSRRSRGRRAHAACDLYSPMHTTVHAVADGVVVRGPYFFYLDTYALEVDHGDFLVRYGGVHPSTFVGKGDRVKAGQPIAKVGRLNMLNFELYGKGATGPLTVPLSESLRAENGLPYMRRKDLIDPTALLNELKGRLPGPYVAPQEVAAVSADAAASLAAARIPSTGFCIYLKRIRQERRASMGFPRTVGEYQCYWDGAAVEGMKGQIVERGGPGDNTRAVGREHHLRIQEGTYRLSIQDGDHYKTYGYQERNPSYENRPNPGLLLTGTRERTAILIHPGEDYVKSIGCLNPTHGLTDANSAFDFADSRARVIAMIETLKSRLGRRFPRSGVIPDASIVIEGEPT
jgi:hypothetical protein